MITNGNATSEEEYLRFQEWESTQPRRNYSKELKTLFTCLIEEQGFFSALQTIQNVENTMQAMGCPNGKVRKAFMKLLANYDRDWLSRVEAFNAAERAREAMLQD